MLATRFLFSSISPPSSESLWCNKAWDCYPRCHNSSLPLGLRWGQESRPFSGMQALLYNNTPGSACNPYAKYRGYSLIDRLNILRTSCSEYRQQSFSLMKPRCFHFATSPYTSPSPVRTPVSYIDGLPMRPF